MRRRQFSLGLLAGISGVTSLTALVAHAQSDTNIQPIEGRNYTLITPALSNDAPEGKIQVVEFFAYSCKFCYRFMSVVENWVEKAPANIHFIRIPVSFREIVEPHARLFYTLEALNRLDLHEEAFKTVLIDRISLISNDEISSFFQKHQVDAKEAMNMFNSFGIQAKVQQANKLWRGYNVQGTPALGIGGQFLLEGANPDNLIVAEQLIKKLSNTTTS